MRRVGSECKLLSHAPDIDEDGHSVVPFRRYIRRPFTCVYSQYTFCRLQHLCAAVMSCDVGCVGLSWLAFHGVVSVVKRMVTQWWLFSEAECKHVSNMPLRCNAVPGPMRSPFLAT